MKCLVIRFSSLGDVILTTPVVESLAAALPDAEIHYATAARLATVVERFPHKVIIHQFAGRNREELLAYAQGFSNERFDMVFDLHANWRSHMLAHRVDAAQVYTYPKDFWRRWSMVYLKRGFDRGRPVVDRYLATIRAGDIPVVTTVPELQGDPKKKRAAADQLTRWGWSSDGITIGIGWGARWPTKKVPTGLWNSLLEHLRSKINPTYIVFAESADKAEVGEFVAQNGPANVFEFCGRQLDSVLGALSLCNIFVTSDSGLMHAAAALGVPTWGIFGPTHPALGFAPVGAQAEAVHSGLFCSPCSRHGKAPCYRKHRYCFEQIDVGLIAQQIMSQLNEASTG